LQALPPEDALKEDNVRLFPLAKVLTMLVILGFALLSAPTPVPAEEAAAWRQEYDSLCSRTLETESMSEQELAQLVDRCDKLKPRIERLEETERKVFLRRLQLCCDLYKYMLDVKRRPPQ
jgi:hypothetical protein